MRNNRHEQHELPHSSMPVLPVATEAADPNAHRILHTPLSLRQYALQMLRACCGHPFFGAVIEVLEELLSRQTMDYVRRHRACLRIASTAFALLFAIADRETREAVCDYCPAIIS